MAKPTRSGLNLASHSRAAKCLNGGVNAVVKEDLHVTGALCVWAAALDVCRVCVCVCVCLYDSSSSFVMH